MTFTNVVIAVIIVLVIYYIGMAVWDQYKEKLNPAKKEILQEDEIDISSEMGDMIQKPIEVYVQPTEESKPSAPSVREKVVLTPFPWSIDKFYQELQSVALGEECKELENVVFTINKNQ